MKVVGRVDEGREVSMQKAADGVGFLAGALGFVVLLFGIFVLRDIFHSNCYRRRYW